MRILFRKRFSQVYKSIETNNSESLDELSNGLPSITDNTTGVKTPLITGELSYLKVCDHETISERLSVSSLRNEPGSEHPTYETSPTTEGSVKTFEGVLSSRRSCYNKRNDITPEPKTEAINSLNIQRSLFGDIPLINQEWRSTECSPISELLRSKLTSPNLNVLTDEQIEVASSKVTENCQLNSSTENEASSHGRSLQPSAYIIPVERIKEAKLEAEEAVRNHKVFAIFGPYHRVRQALRSRGWVEKFYRNVPLFPNQADNFIVTRKVERRALVASPERKSDPESSLTGDRDPLTNELDDDDLDTCAPISVFAEGEARVQPWQERDGYYELMSRTMKSAIPNFIWSLRKSQIDFRYLRKDQLVNHHPRAPFTTKVGLCRFLGQIRWIDGRDCDQFFPRCFVLSNDEERQAFIDDFRLTACMSLLKMICAVHGKDYRLTRTELQLNSSLCNINDEGLSSQRSSASYLRARSSNSVDPPSTGKSTPDDPDRRPTLNMFRIPTSDEQGTITSIPAVILDMAISRCELFLSFKTNRDIDQPNDELSEKGLPWSAFLTWYYKARQSPELLVALGDYADACSALCRRLRRHWSQFDLDGTRNVWIVKPGAKSRGRGITCHNELHEMLNIAQGGISVGDAQFVVQKYIENPLLVYKTKFDIRQWFLVTDWAPLTVWWYNVCYMRFCSQEFTLEDFSESVHLSNNSIQYKYKNGPRSKDLPDDNMWTLAQFQNWLSAQGQTKVWKSKIEPAMKRAIIDSLLCTQESIDVRKNCFGLYGADFIVTEDYKLWLIEINASPCMAPSTSVTAKLTSEVLEDTLKVVLDRRIDRNCDVGKFELIYRQPLPSQLIYTGIDLKVEGIRISPTSGDTRSSYSIIQFGQRPFLSFSVGSSVKKLSIRNCPQTGMQEMTRKNAVRNQISSSTNSENQETINMKSRISKPTDSISNAVKANVPKELEIKPIVRLETKEIKQDVLLQRMTDQRIRHNLPYRKVFFPASARLYESQKSGDKTPSPVNEEKRFPVNVTTVNKTGHRYETAIDAKRGKFHVHPTELGLKEHVEIPNLQHQISDILNESEQKSLKDSDKWTTTFKRPVSHLSYYRSTRGKDDLKNSSTSPVHNKTSQSSSPLRRIYKKKREYSRRPTLTISVIRANMNKPELHSERDSKIKSSDKLRNSANLPSIFHHRTLVKRQQHMHQVSMEQPLKFANMRQSFYGSYSYKYENSHHSKTTQSKKCLNAGIVPSTGKTKLTEGVTTLFHARTQTPVSSCSETLNHESTVDNALLNSARRILLELQTSNKMPSKQSE